MENSETKCPTCGSICKIGGEAETHFFIPVETNKTAEITKAFIDFCKEHNIPDKYAGYLTGLHVKFSTQQSKEKDERIKELENLLKDSKLCLESQLYNDDISRGVLSSLLQRIKLCLPKK